MEIQELLEGFGQMDNWQEKDEQSKKQLLKHHIRTQLREMFDNYELRYIDDPDALPKTGNYIAAVMTGIKDNITSRGISICRHGDTFDKMEAYNYAGRRLLKAVNNKENSDKIRADLKISELDDVVFKSSYDLEVK